MDDKNSKLKSQHHNQNLKTIKEKGKILKSIHTDIQYRKDIGKLLKVEC
jgi:hypothetical protein